jgi:tRNA modification GTPase
LADEAVLHVKALRPIPWLEIHCHGGRQVIELLLEAFAAQGITCCTWQALDKAAHPDPLYAQAWLALANAPTLRTAAILLEQYHGALRSALDGLAQALERGDCSQALDGLAELRRWAKVGRHLTEPWRVVVAGAPNVGKSSLVNALAGFPRCVVAPTPGTTRDVLTLRIALDGWPVELTDTAGLRGTTEDLEAQGIQRARAAAARADLCLWVVDAAALPIWPETELGPETPQLLVINKADLDPIWDLDQRDDAVRVSARTGAGVAELCDRLAHALVPESPPSGTAVPFTSELCACLEAAWLQGTAGRWRNVSQVLGLAKSELAAPGSPTRTLVP